MQDLTKEEKEYIVSRAQKLLLFLKASDMPDDVKDSWVALLPKISFAQMDELVDIFEAKYLDEQTKDIDEKFKAKLNSI